MYLILLRKTFDKVIFMLISSGNEVARDTDIEYSISLVCKQINAILFCHDPQIATLCSQ